jgi:hypothetical protein
MRVFQRYQECGMKWGENSNPETQHPNLDWFGILLRESEREICADNNCLWIKFPIMKEAELEKLLNYAILNTSIFLPWKASKSIHHLHFIECSSPLMDLGWSIWHFWAYILYVVGSCFLSFVPSLCIIWVGGGGKLALGTTKPYYLNLWCTPSFCSQLCV